MASLTKKLDKQWSTLVKVRAKYKCEVCGKNGNQCRLNSHHIIGRTNRMTRWDLKNGCCLCTQHHKFGKQSAHEDAPWFDEWLQKYRKEDYDYVNSIKNTIKKWKPSDKEDLIEEYKIKIKEYEKVQNL